jgi:hypothetical protein
MAQFKMCPFLEQTECRDTQGGNKHSKKIYQAHDEEFVTPRQHPHITEQEQAEEHPQRGVQRHKKC